MDVLGFVNDWYVRYVLDDCHIELLQVPTERYEACGEAY